MNWKTSVLLSLLVMSFVSFNACDARRNQQQEQQEFSDDEFQEFDNIGGDDGVKARQQLKQQQQQAKSSDNEFQEFDNTEKEINEKAPPTTNQKKESQKVHQANQAQQQQQQQQQKQRGAGMGVGNGVGDLDMEEFEHFIDDEEFEGFDASKNPGGANSQSQKEQKSSSSGGKTKQQQEDSKENGGAIPSLKIADVPMHLMSNGNWQNYVYEIVMLILIGVYFVNFIYGKTRNYKLVTAWYNAHRDMLERHFAVVGDDGNSLDLPGGSSSSSDSDAPQTTSIGVPKGDDSGEMGTLIKDSESSYGLWCTGRTMCDGMLVQLKLIKRQDFINGLVMQFIKPQSDQLVLSVEFPSSDSLDPFVFCLTNKKLTQTLFNDYMDLTSYCTERKLDSIDALASSVATRYSMLNELSEIPGTILDSRVCAFLNKYPDMLEYLLVSDQYVGYKAQSQDEQAQQQQNQQGDSAASSAEELLLANGTGLVNARPMLTLCLNIPGKGLNTTPEDMEKMQPAIQLALYLLEKAPRVKLSNKAKEKAVRNRKEVAEKYMKQTHKQRQEAAMLRKEERRRADKERIMNEEDPEKQKRLEEKEIKREKKKNLSRTKQVKIKSM